MQIQLSWHLGGPHFHVCVHEEAWRESCYLIVFQIEKVSFLLFRVWKLSCFKAKFKKKFSEMVGSGFYFNPRAKNASIQKYYPLTMWRFRLFVFLQLLRRFTRYSFGTPDKP